MSNPFEPIIDMYNKQVKDQDAKGTAEKFSTAAQKIFKRLGKYGFTVEDIEFLDGYFIFGMGNSVVHFHIKETPEWLYGIWFEEEDETHVKAEWFCQFESLIDKFKPRASTITGEVSISLESLIVPWLCDFKETIEYIKNHPALAWYRDNYYINFNTFYISEEDAQKEYEIFLKEENDEES